jgi:signal transduction histidine kinase
LTTPTRILLIDDDAGDRAALRAALAASNLIYTLVEAPDAAAGLTEATRESFDCVLLDSRLAAADLLARLTSPEGGRQAVVALTDGVAQETVLALLRAGALDYIARGDAGPHNLARAIRYAKARRGFVFELQAAREDAEAKSCEMEKLNRQKTLILSIIAHDLRNPFQTLLGMSEILVEAANAGDLAAVARRAGGVREAAGQAHGLIESLLGWASLLMDARADTAARLDLDKLLAEAAAGFAERAAAKGVAIEVSPSGGFASAQSDVAAAILRNLIANALKFTAPGGRVMLSAETAGDRVAIVVADTGVGMTAQQTEALFRLEQRSTSAGTDGERGAGLGLLLCRDLCEWIDGEMQVESQPGAGATFRVLLPAGELQAFSARRRGPASDAARCGARALRSRNRAGRDRRWWNDIP